MTWAFDLGYVSALLSNNFLASKRYKLSIFQKAALSFFEENKILSAILYVASWSVGGETGSGV